MKCARIVGQGLPVRLPDDDAFQVVDRDHDGEYCSKSDWKRNGGRYAVLAGGNRELTMRIITIIDNPDRPASP